MSDAIAAGVAAQLEGKHPAVSVTITERLYLPAGTIACYYNELLIYFCLPDGRLLRPYIVYELEEAGDDPRDMGYEELLALGIEQGDIEMRSCDGDIPRVYPERE